MISPYKGFSCAHHVLHEGETCSQYVKRSLLEQDLITAVKLSQKRFNECSEASFILAENQDSRQLPTRNTIILPLSKLRGRRYFLLVTIPAFLVGLATPALAARRSRGIGSCAQASGRAGYREDMEDGQCGNPNIWYGLCCGLSILGGVLGSD